jgi:general secretion pathway protein G
MFANFFGLKDVALPIQVTGIMMVAAGWGAFQIKVGSEGYPPDLDTLVKGVDVGGKKMKFLRRVPIDPMTGSTEGGLRAMQDDPESDSWNGENVFDVYTESAGTGLDGTKYKDW